MKRQLPLIFCLLFFFIHASGQKSKKEAIQLNSLIYKTDTAEISKGYHLELASLYSVEQFAEFWIEHGEELLTKKYGPEKITRLYADSSFTYFGRLSGANLINFFKVGSDELSGFHYKEVDGEEIRNRFMAEVIPTAEREKVERKEKNCGMAVYSSEYTFKYLRESHAYAIRFKWKINCDFFNIVNKTYKSNYLVDTKTFVK